MFKFSKADPDELYRSSLDSDSLHWILLWGGEIIPPDETERQPQCEMWREWKNPQCKIGICSCMQHVWNMASLKYILRGYVSVMGFSLTTISVSEWTKTVSAIRARAVVNKGLGRLVCIEWKYCITKPVCQAKSAHLSFTLLLRCTYTPGC